MYSSRVITSQHMTRRMRMPHCRLNLMKKQLSVKTSYLDVLRIAAALRNLRLCCRTDVYDSLQES